MLQYMTITCALCILTLITTVAAAPVVFEVGGSSATASIQTTVATFRAALGDPNNGNAPGPLPGGRREINWDGGGNNSTTTPPVTPFDVFLNTRGARFTTPETGLTQAPPAADPTQFPPGGLAGLFNNPTYGTTFGTFSPLRLFAPVGSTITDGVFFLPGTAGAKGATISGFGAVFTDVDLPDSTQIEFFNPNGKLLYQDFVPAGTVADQSRSFLGVIFDAGERIGSVRITTGTDPLSATTNDDPRNTAACPGASHLGTLRYRCHGPRGDTARTACQEGMRDPAAVALAQRGGCNVVV